jgi:hypothetical protein
MRLSGIHAILPFALVLSACGQEQQPEPQQQASASLEVPGLRTLITRGDVLLSSAHFNDAARAYSEAIGVYI